MSDSEKTMIVKSFAKAVRDTAFALRAKESAAKDLEEAQKAAQECAIQLGEVVGQNVRRKIFPVDDDSVVVIEWQEEGKLPRVELVALSRD